MMDLIHQAWDLFVHLDKHLNHYAGELGVWLYLVLFMIVFCETGLVVTPFLPGDSLLFAVGSLAAQPDSPLSIGLLFGLLIAAAVLGDAVNYMAGYYVGPKVFRSERSRLFNKKHLLRTHEFYEKYGGKTIVIARFIPIIRTFAPFVAGIAQMGYRQFSVYNITGGALWVTIFLLGGYQFGQQEFVKNNFPVIVVAIIIISVMPMVVELILAWRRSGATGAARAVTADFPVDDKEP
jgi:membrane-associated protein